MPNTSRPKNLGLIGLDQTIDQLAATLKAHHPPELHVWAVVTLAALLDLPTVVGDGDGDHEFTEELMLAGAAEAAGRRRH